MKIILLFLLLIWMFVISHLDFYIAGSVLGASCLTDLADGIIARKFNMISNAGKILDPLADKLLVFCVLVCFIQLGAVSAWVPMIIIAREFFVTCMRVVAVSKGKVIAASWWGKIKTNVQFFSLLFSLVLYKTFPTATAVILWGAAIFTILSWIAYIFEKKEVFKD